MDTDGGGWDLILADNGKTAMYDVPQTTPTPTERGKVDMLDECPSGQSYSL